MVFRGFVLFGIWLGMRDFSSSLVSFIIFGAFGSIICMFGFTTVAAQ